ncbi:hypothetical protein DFP75_11120 [Marinomonas alcarazii]|uniref:Uncharacterized protein n=1 Tax=Marinomonas alcarazii TaxID=491949 RepID=A0A318US63_9GAMM|nr:hypothetical protein DFP75_11120 [Marinomonas alcarazii]
MCGMTNLMLATSETEEEMNTFIQSCIRTGFEQVITVSPIGLSTGYGDNSFFTKR